MSDATVTSVVLNWNDFDMSKKCINSLCEQSYENHNIILVDNGSKDNCAEKLDEIFPEVDVVYNNENLGFSGGMNNGIEAAKDLGTDYVWLLNNDVIIPDKNTIDILVQNIGSNSDLGALTPKVMNYPNTDKEWFTQGKVNWNSGNSTHSPEILEPSKIDGSILYNDYIPFCSALFEMDVFNNIGLLPTAYFLYREDVEFCGRMISNGYKIGTDTSIKVYHNETSSSDDGQGKIPTYYTSRNRWLFQQRMSHQTDRISFGIDYILWSGKTLIQLLQSGKSESIIALIRGTYDGLRGKSGKGPYP